MVIVDSYVNVYQKVCSSRNLKSITIQDSVNWRFAFHGGTSKSSIAMAFSILYHPFGGTWDRVSWCDAIVGKTDGKVGNIRIVHAQTVVIGESNGSIEPY